MRTGTSRRRAHGFTIIELMVVISIIGILAAVAVPKYIRTQMRAKESRLKHDLNVMRELIQQYAIDKKTCGPEALTDLVEGGYLKAVPEDIFTGSSGTWIEKRNEPSDPDDTNACTGIVDVMSGAPGNDLDGKPFAEY